VAAFQLDHNVPARLRSLLRAAGHDVVDAREQSLARAPDADVLLAAALANRIVITHDLEDYRLLNRAWRRWPVAWGVVPPPAHAGILVLPQPPRVTPVDMARAVETALADVRPLANQLWRWMPRTGWVIDAPYADEGLARQ
jgi:hypothetical protein